MQPDQLSALVTGGSRGLGRALARQLAGAGARVVIVARDPETVQRVAAALRAETGGEVHGLAADVGDKQAAHTLVGAATAPRTAARWSTASCRDSTIRRRATSGCSRRSRRAPP